MGTAAGGEGKGERMRLLVTRAPRLRWPSARVRREIEANAQAERRESDARLQAALAASVASQIEKLQDAPSDPELALRGFSQLVWYSTLKASARNWSLSRRPTDCHLRL